MKGRANVHDGTGPHRPGQLALSPPSRSPRCTASRAAPRRRARWWRSRASGASSMAASARSTCSAASAHRPSSIASSASSDSLRTSTSAFGVRVGHGDRLREQRLGPIGRRRRAGAPRRKRERLVAPRAPRAAPAATARLGVGQRLLGARGAHDRPAASPAPTRTTPSRRAGTRSNDAASTTAAQRSRLGGVARQRRDPAGQHGERRVLLDGGVAERGEPPLHASTAGRPGRSAGPARSRAGRTGPARLVFSRCSQRQRGGPVGLVPVRGAQVQLRDDVGLDSSQLAEQELAEQGVVAVPLPPAVERDQEQARRPRASRSRSWAPGFAERRRRTAGAHSWSSTAVRRRNR